MNRIRARLCRSEFGPGSSAHHWPTGAGAAVDQWGHVAIIIGAAGLALLALLLLALLPEREVVKESLGESSRARRCRPARAGRAAMLEPGAPRARANSCILISHVVNYNGMTHLP